ncbi:hypothetical protein CY35_17G071000 [Sphagnum magellanicum]|jgi:hypothetical protein|nr:hypothetical protein CY35_17G071000 [Sphagnum magellanicum]
MLESHSSYGSQLSACQSWLPDFLTSTTNPVSATAAAQAGKVQAARAVQAGGQPCLQAAECSDEVRICAHCGTSKTPLWRNGPQGPKSLCNACGIRHKKAGRRSAATSTSSELQQGCHSVVTAGAVKGGSKRKLEEEIEQQYWIYQRDSQALKHRGGEAFAVQPADSLQLSGTSCNMNWQRSSLLPSRHQCFVHHDNSCHPSLPSIQEEDMLQMKNAFTSDEEEGAILLMALSMAWSMPDYL